MSEPPSAMVSRRRFLGTSAAALAVAGAAVGGGAACSSSDKRRGPATAVAPASSAPDSSTSTSTTAVAKTVRVGYVAEITGPNSARGQFVKASLDAMTGYINAKLAGTYRGLTVEFVPADSATTPSEGLQAYNQLISDSVDAVLWCSPFGLIENLSAVTNGTVPVISVLADLHSYVDSGAVALTGSSAKGAPIFQTALPDAFALDAQLAYASEDRGFASAGLLVDRASYPGLADLFTAAAARRGVFSAVFPYDSSSGQVDTNGPLLTLKKRGAHVVMVYGMADQASTVAAQLQALDAKYIDTPTAKRTFKPMLMGSRWGTGDPSFARLAGDATARATITAGAFGSVLSLPSFPIRTWLHDYVPDYSGFPQGGEDGPADAAALVLDAVVRAGSTKGPELVTALESGNVTTFASSVGVSFASDRHLTVSRDAVVLLSLELPPAPYNVGSEWREVLPKGYTGPTQLIDFTLEANTRAHPLAVADVLARRYGTSAADDYQGGDRAKVAACKAVH